MYSQPAQICHPPHHLLCLLGISRGEKGYAALPGRESDFQASLNTAIEYAVAVNCPRQAHIDLFWLCHFMCVCACVYGDHPMTPISYNTSNFMLFVVL